MVIFVINRQLDVVAAAAAVVRAREREREAAGGRLGAGPVAAAMRLITHNMMSSNVKVRRVPGRAGVPARARSVRVRARSVRERPRECASSSEAGEGREGEVVVARMHDGVLTHRSSSSSSSGGTVLQGVRNGFPLKIEAEEVETREAEFNPDFLRSMMRKLDWKALVASAHTVRPATGRRR